MLTPGAIYLAGTRDHHFTAVLAASVMCSCGWLMSNPDLDDLHLHAWGTTVAEPKT